MLPNLYRKVVMMAEFFLTGDDMAFFVDAVAQWISYGIGFGAVFWIISQCIGLVWQFARF